MNIAATNILVQNAIKGSASEAAFKTAAKQLEAEIEGLLSFVDYYKKVLTEIEAKYKRFDTGTTMSFKTGPGSGSMSDTYIASFKSIN